MTALIETAAMAARMRERIIRPDARRILVSRLEGSGQEADLTSPVNCRGLGRVRHFREATSPGWPANFLPLGPAEAALGLAPAGERTAQVFQNAACAWRCWYCYVPFELLGGDPKRSEWVDPDELVAMYAQLEVRPPILDLSGGSPDLTPEWVPWTMEALDRAGIAETTYLWSDDNLSTDYVFDCLTEGQRRWMAAWPRYGRVCCFKGFDPASFAFNTGAAPADFERQFERFARYLDLGLDLYAYVTLTGQVETGVEDAVAAFVGRLAALSPDLPARTVPLEIQAFGPTAARMTDRDLALPFAVQAKAIRAWNHATSDLIGSC